MKAIARSFFILIAVFCLFGCNNDKTQSASSQSSVMSGTTTPEKQKEALRKFVSVPKKHGVETLEEYERRQKAENSQK